MIITIYIHKKAWDKSTDISYASLLDINFILTRVISHFESFISCQSNE